MKNHLSALLAPPLPLLLLLLLLLLRNLASVRADEPRYKLCVHESKVSDCYAVERGGSRVKCVPVVDSAECAIRMGSGEADFGVFGAEELLLAYQFLPQIIRPLFQLKHKDKIDAEFEFESVAVVLPEYESDKNGTEGRYAGLLNGGLCHPGFSREQWWNDYILKYMERRVYNYDCRDNVTAAENELLNVKSFFGNACRPGPWVSDDTLDHQLKNRYPELCSLCDEPSTCKYNNTDNHGHYGALDCLTSGRGKIAYVALAHARNYFKTNDSYRLLCPDGSVQDPSANVPCTWLSQPWRAIVARRDVASELGTELAKWLGAAATYSADPWEVPLKIILCGHDYVPSRINDNASLVTYLAKGRPIDFPNTKSCGKTIRWCTVSAIENEKCDWIAKESLILGVEPKLGCKLANSTFQCFRDVAAGKADILTIDSNYGHLARQVYGLKTLLYTETDSNKNSMVLAVVRKPVDGSAYPVSSLRDLRGKAACFPEYGGIAWLSFVHVARTNGMLASDSCNYPEIVSNFFSGACTPGFRDADHSNGTATGASAAQYHGVLCSSCPADEKNATIDCSASPANRYYGDRGALRCLSEGYGDVAFIEARNLNEDGTIDPNAYHILCRNGSLAGRPGFHFDDQCALSVTIDSEVVARRRVGSEIEEQDATLTLLKLEDWLGYRVGAQRPIHIYDRFNGTRNLLFKDSTSGLVPTTSDIKTVLAYKELFSHVETCTSGTSARLLASYLLPVALLLVLTIDHRAQAP